MDLYEIFYTAVCYIPLAIFLFTVVLISPALAFFPSLIRSPLLATSIPIISILLVNSIGLFLFTLHKYQHAIVLGITLLLFFISIIRVKSYANKNTLDWEKNDLYLLLINLGILLPLIAFCGLSSFRSNDALASWNYWGLLFYHGKVPDTIGYPPFFSILISYCYHVLGNINYQGVVKVLLVAFPFTMMNAIAFSSQKTKDFLLFYLCLICIVVFPGFLQFNFYTFHALGYADSMLAAAIATSLMLLLKYLTDPSKKEYLLFAVLCGITASLSKQPGLLWCYLAFPALIIAKFITDKKIDSLDAKALLLLFIPAGVWLSGAGRKFYDNEGVMVASLKQEHVTSFALFKSFIGSIQDYFILQPTLLILFILTIFACRHSIYRSVLLLFFIIPGFILWFTLGSYHIRLGLYLLVCCAVLVAANDYLGNTFNITKLKKSRVMTDFLNFTPKKAAPFFLVIGFLVFVSTSFTRQIDLHHFTSEHVHPLNAKLTNSYHFFDDQAEFVYRNILTQKDVKIYSADRYVTAIFYGNTTVIPHPHVLNEKNVYEYLKTYQPDYVFASFCVKKSLDCETILEVSKNHPGLLIPIPMKHAKWDARLYQLNKDLL